MTKCQAQIFIHENMNESDVNQQKLTCNLRAHSQQIKLVSGAAGEHNFHSNGKYQEWQKMS